MSLAESWQKNQSHFEHLCVIASLVGWQLIREKDLENFAKCKQHEFLTILHLLEHVVPLVFYRYNVFRSGDVKLYEEVMAQTAIIFNRWRRRQYNKSTLSYLSYCALMHQCKHLPEYWSKKTFSNLSQKKRWRSGTLNCKETLRSLMMERTLKTQQNQ